jgi:predicted PurR-regulated permease PerM
MRTNTITPGRLHAALVIAGSAWIIHGFLPALLAAGVVAVASWPLYRGFRMRLGERVGRHAATALFTFAMTMFVLAPLAFACLAFLGEAHATLVAVAQADSKGMAPPAWLPQAPIVGRWLAEQWQAHLAHPGALLTWTQHADPAALVGVAQSLGEFTARHLLIVGFTVLLLHFLYLHGAFLAREFMRSLAAGIGEHAGRFVDVALRAVRASVNSMLLVGLFDGLATGIAYAIAGAPRAFVWATITGALAAIPFLGYVAVLAMAVQLAVQYPPGLALSCLVLGCVILLGGDKIVRPLVAREGMQLPYVWVLMGCIGGFEVLGLAGLVIGPVVLTLAQELWSLARAERGDLEPLVDSTRSTGSNPPGRPVVRKPALEAADDAAASGRA